ncbi:hypothetical protein AOLI_G00114070 [Acnodon oligacanthus]
MVRAVMCISSYVYGGCSPSGVFTTPLIIRVVLYHNQVEVLRVWEYQDDWDKEDYATNSAVLALEPHDTMSHRLPKDFQVATSAESSIHIFSAFLLYQLRTAKTASQHLQSLSSRQNHNMTS